MSEVILFLLQSLKLICHVHVWGLFPLVVRFGWVSDENGEGMMSVVAATCWSVGVRTNRFRVVDKLMPLSQLIFFGVSRFQ